MMKKNAIVSGMRVEVRGGDIAKAMRRFKKKIAEDGMLQELRAREFFQSKGHQTPFRKTSCYPSF